MAYLAGLIVVAVFFMALHYFTELDHKQKAVVTLFAVALVGGAIAYNAYSDAQREKILDIERKYHQGKSLQCDGVEVTNKTFSYSVGTQTFIGNEGTEHYQRMISADRCR
jgi:hypothetical protein